MAGKDLTITLTAKDGTSTVFKQVGTEAERMGQKVTTASDKSSASMKKWSEAGRALGLSMGAVGILSSKIAGDAEASTARMTTAFENVGLSVDDFKDKISDLTGTGLKLAFDDEDVQDSLARLITTTGNAEKAMRDVGVAEDLARAQGISLASATDIVNAAEAGRFRGLQQLGIVLGKNATSEEAIAALQGRVAGQAEAYSQTTAASYERMKNTAENYLEAVGGFVNQHGQMALALGGIATAVGPAAEGIKALSVAMKGSAVAGAALDLALGPVGVALAVAAAGVALYELTQRESDNEKATKALKAATDGYISTIADETTALANLGLLQAAKDMQTYLEAIETGGLVAQDRIDAVNKAITELQDQSQLSGTEQGFVLADLNAQFGSLDQTQKDYINSVLELSGAWADGVVTASELQAVMPTLQDGFELTKDQAAGLTTAMTAVTKALQDPQLFGRELGDRAKQILGDMHDGVISVDEAITELNALPLDETFNRAKASADSAKSSIDNMVDSLYGSAAAFGAEAKAIEDTTIALREHKQAVDDAFVATNYSASLPVITQYQSLVETSSAKTDAFSAILAQNAAAAADTTQALRDLNTELSDKGAEGLDRYMGMIVGFTDGIVDSTGKAKKWADNLIAPVGVYSELDNLLANGKITLDQYNAAQQAQIDITNDDARAQAARNQIQAEQAPLIAAQADAAADYIEKLAGMSAGEQELALAYADPAQAKRITDIADMAAGYHDMTDAQKEAFAQTVTGAAAADPALAAVLQSLGLIKASTTDPTGWEVNMDTVNSQTAIDKLTTSMVLLITTITGTPDVAVAADLDTAEFWAAYYALPSSKDLTLYIHHVDTGDDTAYHAIGGVANFATGGMVHLAELGPEMLRYPSGQIGMAYREGNYMVPSGTHVDTANATASTLSARGNGKPSLHLQGCTFYITPATPDLHDAIASTVLRGGL